MADSILIDNTNYKNYTSNDIKKYVNDKDLRKQFLRYHLNKRYYINKQLDENNHIKKKHCDLCDVDVVLMARHKQGQKHIEKEDALTNNNKKYLNPNF